MAIQTFIPYLKCWALSLENLPSRDALNLDFSLVISQLNSQVMHPVWLYFSCSVVYLTPVICILSGF